MHSPRFTRTPEARSGPRVRSTQRVAADALLLALRRTTAVSDKVHAVDEVMSAATSALLGLNDEVRRLETEASELRSSLSAAYSASAEAAAEPLKFSRALTHEAQALAEDRANEVVALTNELKLARSSEAELLRTIDRSAANARLLEARLARGRQAASRVLNALPASAAEAALEAERLGKVARPGP